MKGSRWVQVLCVCIFFCWITPPSVAFFDPAMVISTYLLAQKPGYQKTSQDYLDDGNFWKGKCMSNTALYNERLRAYVRDAADAQNAPFDMSVLQKSEPPEPFIPDEYRISCKGSDCCRIL